MPKAKRLHTTNTDDVRSTSKEDYLARLHGLERELYHLVQIHGCLYAQNIPYEALGTLDSEYFESSDTTHIFWRPATPFEVHRELNSLVNKGLIFRIASLKIGSVRYTTKDISARVSRESVEFYNLLRLCKALDTGSESKSIRNLHMVTGLSRKLVVTGLDKLMDWGIAYTSGEKFVMAQGISYDKADAILRKKIGVPQEA